MDLHQAIFTRRSIRDFTADVVDRDDIDTLIEAAIQAPSAVNRQSWSFRVIAERQMLNHISELAKSHLLRERFQDPSLAQFEQRLRDPAFNIFYNAPILIVISSKEEGVWGQIDCALAAQNMMLTARAIGLGSCWIGFARPWLDTAEGKGTLDLPATFSPVAPIIVGHPAAGLPPVPRAAPDVRWI